MTLVRSLSHSNVPQRLLPDADSVRTVMAKFSNVGFRLCLQKPGKVRTCRNLDAQNRHTIQDAGSAEKVCWFLSIKPWPREWQEQMGPKKETVSIPSYQESPGPIEGDTMPVTKAEWGKKKRQKEKLFFLEDTAVGREGRGLGSGSGPWAA